MPPQVRSRLRWPWVQALLRHRAAVILIGLWLALALGSGFALLQGQRQSRAQIESRFDARAATTARFVETYVSELAAQERRVAERTLTGAEVTREQFASVVTLLGTEAAVLLDSEGRVLRIQPSAPQLVGRDLSAVYPHLRTAVEGGIGISETVPSAARGLPISAFAVPFSSSAGRRVLSGGFAVRNTPLAQYLRRAGATAPNRVYLVDTRGVVVAGNVSQGFSLQNLSAHSPQVARALASQDTAGHTGDDEYFVAHRVAGTPWRLVMVAPEGTLYQTIDGSKRWIPWLLWVGFVAGGLACVVLVRRLIASRGELRESNAQLDRLARIDPLTGLANRRSMEELLHSTVASAGRHHHDAAVLMVDVDHFKAINDTYGHAAGDDVLTSLATTLHEHLREADVVGRWGGEEFLVVLPFTDSEGAEVVADRLRERVAETPMLAGGQPISITISIGSAAWQQDEPLSPLLHRTDAALYQAKERGRNRVVSAEATRADHHEIDDDEPRTVRERDAEPVSAHPRGRS